MRAEISNMRADHSSMRAEISKMQADHNSMRAEISNMQAENDYTQAELKKLRAEMTASDLVLTGRIAVLEVQSIVRFAHLCVHRCPFHRVWL